MYTSNIIYVYTKLIYVHCKRLDSIFECVLDIIGIKGTLIIVVTLYIITQMCAYMEMQSSALFN